MTEQPKLDDQLDEMQERSTQLGDEISEARKDWKQKVADEKVPGTPPAPTGDDQDDEREPWPDE